MMTRLRSALLLTDVREFAMVYTEIAYKLGVELRVEGTWHEKYKVEQERLICGAKHLVNVNRIYYGDLFLLLAPDDKLEKYLDMGIRHFIFNHRDVRELAMVLCREVEEVKGDRLQRDVVAFSGSGTYVGGEYSFDFRKGEYSYCGRRIYLTKGEEDYLARWLLLHEKSNRERYQLYRMRSRFGRAFLSDFDRYGKPMHIHDEGGSDGV